MSEEPSDGLSVLGPALGVHPEAVQAQVLAGQGRDSAASSQEALDHDSQDPSYITRMEHFEGIRHHEIYEHAQAIKVGAITSMGETWRKIANGLSAKILGSRLALHRVLSEGFGGEFAEAAETAANTFFGGADDLQRAVSAVGYRVGAVAGAAEAVKLSVPPPPNKAPQSGAGPMEGAADDAAQIAGLFPGAESPSAVADQMRQKEEQRQVAIGVMNSVYKPNYRPAGDGVPTFVPVKAPEDGPPGNGPSNPGGGNPSGPGAPGPSSPPGGPGDTSGEQPGKPTPGEDPQTAPANTESGPGNPAGQQPGSPPPGSPQGDSQRSTPASAPSGPPGSPTGSPGSPSGPGSPNSSGGPGSPGGPNQPPPPGRSVPGVPGGPAGPAGNAPPAGAPRGGGRPPMGGMPMGGASGGGRNGNDESERKTPDYLVTDRQDELIGPDQPMMPPTIGDDAASTRPASDGDNYQ